MDTGAGSKKEMLPGGNARHGESRRFGNTSQYRNVGFSQMVAKNGSKWLKMKKDGLESNTVKKHSFFA
ncbi:MAG: hypothetical protein NVSMB33_06100 [Ktedonobacteraceae bacterium]